MRKIEPITAGQLAEFQGRLVRSLEYNGIDRDEFQKDFIQGDIINELLAFRTTDWLRQILGRERQCHKDFFGQEFDLSGFRKTLIKHGQEAVTQWQELGLEPHFLPPVAMRQDADFPGWKVKPKSWYYQQVAEGKVLLRQKDDNLSPDTEAYKLTGVTVLVDTRLNPEYDNGKQMFENDNLLGPIIEHLRNEKKIAEHKGLPQSSRFGISDDDNEWEKSVKPALADFLKMSVEKVRLERAIEGNVIPQLYPHMPRRKDGQTITWAWYEEHFIKDHLRLFGGRSNYGGLSDVKESHWDGGPWWVAAFRPLIVLEN